MNVPQHKSLKPLPKFDSEEEEREFWATHDSTEHVDWSRAKHATFSRLKPSTQTISLRLPESVVENLKLLANKRDVPYQSLLKIFLAERIEQELQDPARGGRVAASVRKYDRSHPQQTQVREKRRDTTVATLRKTYGPDFAAGFRGNTTLRTLLERTGAKSLADFQRHRMRVRKP